jgi:hypothetical protein
MRKPGSKVRHAFAVHLQDLGGRETAHQRLPDLGRIGTRFRRE